MNQTQGPFSLVNSATDFQYNINLTTENISPKSFDEVTFFDIK